ncbi:MAG: helix-turn-helix transcriptional regulator [Clostridiales bacterium]|nr:helix-turn-helix transcriptional regulator [Clostridiales bacterium]
MRIEKVLTQQGLAEAINVSSTAISKWENGHSLPGGWHSGEKN